ncbi:MAG: rRNA maturation RNase YbeY [Pyrinomonadaceae bacterium]|nr:rRNA maturation RNase YbeY [Pyrinomonadaceae bacterium]
MIEIVNHQRGRQLSAAELKTWREFAEKALRAIKSEEAGNASATIVFVGDRRIRSLNKEYRGRASVTDVLSFPSEQTVFERKAEANLGDVVISIPQAERQSIENALSFEREIAQLILHGLLHLCGYDHETDNGQMNHTELRLRRRLRI